MNQRRKFTFSQRKIHCSRHLWLRSQNSSYSASCWSVCHLVVKIEPRNSIKIKVAKRIQRPTMLTQRRWSHPHRRHRRPIHCVTSHNLPPLNEWSFTSTVSSALLNGMLRLKLVLSSSISATSGRRRFSRSGPMIRASCSSTDIGRPS